MRTARTAILCALAGSMAFGQLAPFPEAFPQFFDNSGKPLSGGKIDVYLAGTTTRTVTYVDATGNSPNANPIVLDSAGRAAIWLGGLSYKFVLKNSSGVTIKTVDNVPGASPQVRRLYFLDNSGSNSTGSFSAEADLAPGQCVWSIRDPAGALPLILDCVNNKATFAYNTEIGTGGATRSLTVNGSETVTGTLTVGSCVGCGQAVGVNVTSANPMYLYAHFRDDKSGSLFLSYSLDAANWQDVNKEGSLTALELRDPSMYKTDDGIYHFLATPHTGVNIQYWTSTDLQAYSIITTIDMSSVVPAATNAWAPEFFHDPVSGNDYFLVAVSTDSAAHFTPYLCQINLSTGTLTNAQALTLNGTSRGQTFDYFMYYSAGNSTYYMAYADQSGSSVQRIEWATSTTLTGAYTQALSSDYLGFTDRSEAPAIIPLPNGCLRVYADVFIDLFGGWRKYAPQYRDSCSATPFATLVNASPSKANISEAEHGTIIKLTKNEDAGVVFAAQNRVKSDNYVAGRFGVGTPTPFFTMTIKSQGANGGLQYDEPATYGADAGDGAAATWSACSDSASRYCPAPFGGSARWVMNFNSTANSGMVQFNNTNVGGPSSIQFSNGLFTYGQSPAAVNGGKAIWEMGEDNNCFGPNASCANPANDWFFIHSGGTNDFVFGISPTTGEVRANYGVTFGGGGATGLLQTDRASLHSPAAGVLDLGAGTLTEANPTGKLRIGALSTGNTSNTDLAGYITLSGGTGTYTFGGTYSTPPVCFATDSTANASVKASTTTTVLTLTGTGTDVVAYACIARN